MFLFKITYSGASRSYINFFTASDFVEATHKAETLACGSSYRLEVIQ